MVEIHPVLKSRQSRRSFSPQPIEPEKLETLLEAFRWAPSSNNRQPWRIIVVRSRDAHRRFDECLSETNLQWATAAPVKMIILGHPEEQPERNGQQRYLLDVGLAIENLLIQGCALGMTAHAMTGWDEAKVLKLFNVPKPFRVAALFSVGYPGKFEDLHPEVQEKEKKPSTRKSQDEIFFWDDFGQKGRA
ncbi:MAG: nitroreductase family protein [Nitrospinota bacterium]